ncbi:MAG: LD-carboxypeptidase [Myxococcales bacterium]|nr:LD-carboxypeptidase [Myxococcales bacterium]
MLTQPGPIAVVAPSHAFDPERLRRGMALATQAGLSLLPFPDLEQRHRYFAGTDAHRGAQLVSALTDDGYSAVWMARGGSGAMRLLEQLQGKRLRADRPVIGFSDVTALFSALHARGAGPLVHGPVLHSLEGTDPTDRQHLLDLLVGKPGATLQGATWRPGSAEGWLCGGNLCVLAALCGTPWQLKARGAILVLEEIGEHPYRIDRMLQQLAYSGVLDGVAGVAVGELIDCDPPSSADYTLRDVFAERLAPLGIPVVGQLPIGHGSRNSAFVWGATARLGDGQLTWEAAGPIKGMV